MRSPHAVVGGLFLPEPLRPSLSHRRPELAVVGDLTQEIACTRIEEAAQFLTVHGIAVLRLMPAHEDRRLTPREVDRAVVIDECITLEPQRVVVRAHGELKRLPAIEGGSIDCIARRSAERGGEIAVDVRSDGEAAEMPQRRIEVDGAGQFVGDALRDPCTAQSSMSRPSSFRP